MVKSITEKDLDRIFRVNVKPIADKDRRYQMTLDDWERYIKLAFVRTPSPDLIEKIKGRISTRYRGRVLFPEIFLKNKIVYETKRAEVKKSIKKLRKLLKPVPKNVLVRFRNLERAKSYSSYFKPSTIKKISKFNESISFVMKRNKLFLKIRKRLYSEKQFVRLKNR